MSALVELVRAVGEHRLRRRAERAAERARRRAERQERRRAAEAAKTELRERRVKRRRDRAARFGAAVRAARPVVPVALVTVFAIVGQIAYGLEHYTPPSAPWPVRVLVAVGAAVTVESIANYVQWHAHEAYLMGETATAARLRFASYLIALVVAGLNYSHFSVDLRPTAGAVMFGLFSALQPWLWGLHTRRAKNIQLRREGRVDDTGAIFSAARWFAFPVRTWRARRYSIAHSITDPREAWEKSEAERMRRREERARLRETSPLRVLLTWLLARTPVRADRADTATRTPVREDVRPDARTPSEPVRTPEPVRGEDRTGVRIPVRTPVHETRTPEPVPPYEPVRTGGDVRPVRDDQPARTPKPVRPISPVRTDGGTDDAVRPRRRLQLVDDQQRLEVLRAHAREHGPIRSVTQVRGILRCNRDVAQRLYTRLQDEPSEETDRVLAGAAG